MTAWPLRWQAPSLFVMSWTLVMPVPWKSQAGVWMLQHCTSKLWAEHAPKGALVSLPKLRQYPWMWEFYSRWLTQSILRKMAQSRSLTDQENRKSLLAPLCDLEFDVFWPISTAPQAAQENTAFFAEKIKGSELNFQEKDAPFPHFVSGVNTAFHPEEPDFKNCYRTRQTCCHSNCNCASIKQTELMNQNN